ncbi:hypothetical protein [Lichenifustis flavocetrariae]|uniref:Uncharacterized protein n=1 Tax=Lichenifustis flavocetrariae TaxID=2949735 RepID=A0AA42CJ26_9HYPH|nr:hypothetical protein [Lichenifustis flavocetrariae]MCW6508989.1 hypothetical protein [Lichenifustis flavocetrariae]
MAACRAERGRLAADLDRAAPAAARSEAVQGRQKLGAADPHQAREADDHARVHDQGDIMRRLPAGPRVAGLGEFRTAR